MRVRIWIVLLALVGCLAGVGCKPPAAQIPITTASEDAREEYLKGRTAYEQFQPELARAYFMKALAQDPEFALAHLGLALVSEDPLERREWAEAAADKARSASRGERLLIRSYRAVERQDFRTAFLKVKELVERYPREARAHLALGDAHLAYRNLGDAIKSYRDAIELEPDLAAAHRNLGRAFLAFADHREAKLALTRHLELLPDLPASHELLAMALMKGGAFDESIARFKDVQRLDSDSQSAWIGIGYNLLFRGDPDQALAHFQQVSDATTDDGIRRQALEQMAAVHVDTQNPTQAVELLERAYALATDAPRDAHRIKRLLGYLYMNEGKPDEAADQLKQALVEFRRIGLTGPRSLVGRTLHGYDLSRLKIARGQIEEGKAAAMKFRRGIGNSRIHGVKDMWGELQTRLALMEGDTDRARDQISRVSDADPRIIFLAAQVQEALGQTGTARQSYKKVAEFNQPVFELFFVRTKARRLVDSLGSKPD